MQAPALTPARVRRAVARWGVRGTARQAALKLARTRARQRWKAADRDFDARHGTDTAGIVSLDALEIPSANREHGERYQATTPSEFARVMAGVPMADSELTFIDLGAGKGRAMLLASEYAFRRIVGVEFAPALVDAARRNLDTFRERSPRCGDFDLICGDVAGYDFPDEPALVYVYNSFAAPVMRRVLERLDASIHQHPRRVVLALMSSTCPPELLEETGWRADARDSNHSLYVRREAVRA